MRLKNSQRTFKAQKRDRTVPYRVYQLADGPTLRKSRRRGQYHKARTVTLSPSFFEEHFNNMLISFHRPKGKNPKPRVEPYKSGTYRTLVKCDRGQSWQFQIINGG